MPDGTPLWRGMDRAALDRAYNNTEAVADSAARLADWSARSAVLRAAHPALLDLAYGPAERQRIDLFRCGRAGAPLLVFVHGGYWQRNAKEMFACFAAGPLARGLDVALPGYTLAPQATLTGIVAEIAQAVRWLRREGPARGVGEGRLILSGWSAGGHLTAMNMGLPGVDAGLAVSGVFDVEPCRLNYLNAALRLAPEEAAAMSPLHHPPPRAGALVCAYGTAELPELQRQSEAFARAWTRAGLDVRAVPLAGHDHFSILEEFANPDGALVEVAAELARPGPR